MSWLGSKSYWRLILGLWTITAVAGLVICWERLSS